MKRSTFNLKAGLVLAALGLSTLVSASAATINVNSRDSVQAAVHGARSTKHHKKEDAAVHALFDLASPITSPFPSDRFTLPDADQNTGRRVNLPKPADCVANASDCEEIDSLNELDGFSAAPWLSIPFDGDVDPNTIAGNVFLIALGDTLAPQSKDRDDEADADDDDKASVGDSGFRKIDLN